jgi:hypothetical protein
MKALFRFRQGSRLVILASLIAGVGTGVGIGLAIAKFLIYIQNLNEKPKELMLKWKKVGDDYFVKVRIQGKWGWMLVDTGASCTMVSAFVPHFLAHTATSETENVFFSFNNQNVKSKVIYISDIQIGKWRIKQLRANVSDVVVCNPTVIDGSPMFGWIGYDLLSRWRIVKMTKHHLIVSDAPFTPPPTATKFRMSLIDRRPHVIAEFARNQPQFWLLDTGVEEHLISSEVFRHIDKSLFQRVKNSSSSGAIGMMTIEKSDAQGRQTFKVEGEVIKSGSPPFVCPNKSEEHTCKSVIIGNSILDQYDVVIDNKEMMIYFIPIK